MGTQPNIRPPAVAGQFYTDDPDRLRAEVDLYIREGHCDAGPVKAIIAPHAGYLYSGPIAGSAYKLVKNHASTFHRVVLLGPSHRVAFQGIAAPTHEAFETPLGKVPLDRAALSLLIGMKACLVSDRAHAHEHGLEVQLPFLQRSLTSFKLVPLVVGEASTDEIAAVIEKLCQETGTLLVVSSDLSHYMDYRTAQRMDAEASVAIENLDEQALRPEQACGYAPMLGLLRVARNRGWKARTIDLRNSGDTAGPKNEVVGYGAYAFA